MRTLIRRLSLPGFLLVGAALICAVPNAASAGPITKQLNVTVRLVCDNVGANCASSGPAGDAFFETEADKIWAQAGIDINFLMGTTLDNTALQTGGTGVASFTSSLAGPGTTMYVVDDLVCPSCTLFGEAYLGAGGLVINMGAVLAYSAAGRIDTIAHELGHNLGLDHDDTNHDYLIASGSVRNIPTSVADICPDGACYDLLSQAQIDTTRRSNLLVDFNPVPEPGSLALVAVALFSAAGVASRRRA